MQPVNSIVNCDMIDWISDLPDSVVGNILSFLPTEEVVATSLLSRRWRHVLKTTVCSLDFCQKFEKDDRIHLGKEAVEIKAMNFVRFVNHVLLLLDVGMSLHKFGLAWDPTSVSLSYADSWINIAIKRNVGELSLKVPYGYGPLNVFVPSTVFTCESIKYLELDGSFSVSSTTSVFCLPRLETLKLVGILFECETCFEKLITKCPMLTSLHYLHRRLRRFIPSILDIFTCRISSTSLRRLELDFKYTCSLKLDAPSLEYFRLHGYANQIFVQRNLFSLVEADLQQFRISSPTNHTVNYKLFAQAFCALDCTKALTLSIGAIRALSGAKLSLSTEFKRLVKLVAETESTDCSFLQDLIQRSDNLQLLRGYQQLEYALMRFTSYVYHDPIEVPRCLSNCLKKVIIDGFDGLEDERKKIIYLLEHASVLQEMKIFSTGVILDANLELVQEILTFPRKSAACQVQFFLKSDSRKRHDECNWVKLFEQGEVTPQDQ